MTDNEVTSDTPADIDSYVEPLPESTEDSAEPARRDIDFVAGEHAIGGDLLQRIIEGALLTAGKPMGVADLGALFEDHERPAGNAIREALAAIGERYAGRGFELREVASGFRFQVVQDVATWIARLWEEKPQRYSRALLETLALIAYRQPITRGDIEDIRGVAVASNIMKTLVEREWVRIVGHKDVPGRPAMYATTRKFLDYFNLKNLDDLPPLAEIRDLDSLNAELALEGADTPLIEQSPAPETVSDDDGGEALQPMLSEFPEETAGDGDELPA
jgi:segregation and condensation protein B